MYSDTILFETALRSLYSYALREGRMLAHHGVMTASIGASGRFYNAHRGL